MDFKEKVVVVTGAGQGLGEAYARAFAHRGAKVALVDLNAENVEQVRTELEAEGHTALDVVCDISKPKVVEKQFSYIAEILGPVDVLVNNAAFHQSNPILETSTDIWQLQIDVNLNGAFYCTKAVLPAMIERKAGKIINISSSAAKFHFPGFAAYSASKAGIISFTHSLSEEVKHHNINVNAVLLGMINTEHTRERIDYDEAVTIPLDEMMQVDDVSDVVLFLASDLSKSIMGAAVDVFGKHA